MNKERELIKEDEIEDMRILEFIDKKHLYQTSPTFNMIKSQFVLLMEHIDIMIKYYNGTEEDMNYIDNELEYITKKFDTLIFKINTNSALGFDLND